ELKIELRPESESGNKKENTLYGTGKFQIQYERLMYSSGALAPRSILRDLATGKLELEIKSDPPPVKKEPKEKEDQSTTAWGKEISGLQAGLSIRPGEKRVFRHGDVITLAVRVRNVGKETVKFEYVRQFLDENQPTVTNADGTTVKQHGGVMLGEHFPKKVSLEPGKEIELDSGLPRFELRPAKGGGEPTTAGPKLFVGTGKVGFQYERVFGSSSSGKINLDPALSNLATGKLELEINPKPPEEKK